MSVQNLNSFGKSPPKALTDKLSDLPPVDPFAEEGDPLADTRNVGSQADYIHIRIQQRNGRKTLTTLQGLSKGRYLYRF